MIIVVIKTKQIIFLLIFFKQNIHQIIRLVVWNDQSNCYYKSLLQMDNQALIEGEAKEINNDINLQKDKTFATAGLNKYLIKCYEKLGYKQPTPIQYYSISTYLEQECNSIVAQSKSGTGKTLSYLSIILTHAITLGNISKRCSFLVILPTRQLSLQVYQTFKEITNTFNLVKAQNSEEIQIRQKLKQIRVLMCIGGIPFEDDKRNYLTNGGTVIIGTVGRILQFFDKKLIKVNQMEMLVLDQGDKLFQNKNRKFTEVIDNVLSIQSNHNYKVKSLIYSATFTQKLIKQISKKRKYTYIQTLGSDQHGIKMNITNDINGLLSLDNIVDKNMETSEAVINLENIKKYKLIINSEQQSFFNAKITALISILHQLKYQRCLVFVQKKTLLEQINERIIEEKLQSLLIHGSLSQSSRIKLMNQINHSKIIIASDLLARGIDLELDLVILFDAKKNDTFWHRIGRTGRYGSKGVAISLDDISDWKIYDREEVQAALTQIQLTFDKNKEWYGTYLTQIGRWNQTNQAQELELEKQFNYFDEKKFIKGRKINKKQQQQNDSSHIANNQHRKCVETINNLQSQQQLQKLIKVLLKCQKCKELMKSIQLLTGYQFNIKKYE